MDHGHPPPPESGVFLVQCAESKCLAVRGDRGRWKCLHDDSPLPGDTEAIMAVPIELIAPFVPAIRRARLRPVRLRGQD